MEVTNEYYQKRKERIQKKPRERYQNLSEEEKDKKDRWKKVQESYQILTKEEEEKRQKNSLLVTKAKASCVQEKLLFNTK